MKPKSDKAFSEICNQFSLDCEDDCSQATYLALSQIAVTCSPETYPDTYKEGFMIHNQEKPSDKDSFIEFITTAYKLVINSKSSVLIMFINSILSFVIRGSLSSSFLR